MNPSASGSWPRSRMEAVVKANDMTVTIALELGTRTNQLSWHIVARMPGADVYGDLNAYTFKHVVHRDGKRYTFTSMTADYSQSNADAKFLCSVDEAVFDARLPEQPNAEDIVRLIIDGHSDVDGAVKVLDLHSISASDGDAAFDGCTPELIAPRPDGVADHPERPPNGTHVANDDGMFDYVSDGIPGAGRRLRTAGQSFGGDVRDATWPVQQGELCSMYKPFSGERSLWAYVGEVEAKRRCADDSDCTAVVQYTACCGGKWFFACSGQWDGETFAPWPLAATHVKPEAMDAIEPDVQALSIGNMQSIIDGDVARVAAVQAGSATDATTFLGPLLVVMINYQGRTPARTIDGVKAQMFGSPGLADVMSASSWGAVRLRESDVDFVTIEATVDPLTWRGSLGGATQHVYRNIAFQGKYNSRSYTRVMMMLPGNEFRGTAYLPGTFSQYEGSGGISWTTMAHELGHNLHLHHAGACYDQGFYQQYSDSTIMGWYRGASVLHDFNAPARWLLGWLDGRYVLDGAASTANSVTLTALNLGPAGASVEETKLMARVPCPECVSASDGRAESDGEVHLSFRAAQAGSKYGVENNQEQKVYTDTGCSSTTMSQLENEVHVHYYTGRKGSRIELWNAIGAGESYKLPGSNTFVHVCEIKREVSAAVTWGDSVEDATAKCPGSEYAPSGPVKIEFFAPGNLDCGVVPDTSALGRPVRTVEVEKMAFDGGGVGRYNGADRRVNDPVLFGWQSSTNFAARLSQPVLHVQTAGTYTFSVALGDADTAKLVIDGAPVLQTPCTWRGRTQSVTKTLAAGVHSVELIYVDDGWADKAAVAYRGPDTANIDLTIPGSIRTRTVSKATLHGRTYATCQGTYVKSTDLLYGKPIWDRDTGSRFIFWCGNRWRVTGSQWRQDFLNGRVRHCGSFISSNSAAENWYEADWSNNNGATASAE